MTRYKKQPMSQIDPNPIVGLELQDGNDGQMALIAFGNDGTSRKIFTLYPDGTGYLNKWKSSHIPGLLIDNDGRLIIRDARGLR